MEPQRIFRSKFATSGTTRFKLIVPTLKNFMLSTHEISTKRVFLSTIEINIWFFSTYLLWNGSAQSWGDTFCVNKNAVIVCSAKLSLTSISLFAPWLFLLGLCSYVSHRGFNPLPPMKDEKRYLSPSLGLRLMQGHHIDSIRYSCIDFWFKIGLSEI